MSQEKPFPENELNQMPDTAGKSELPGLEFSRLISMERALRWETAKKFWTEKKDELGCSYNRYSVIEKGTAKASLDLAKKIIQALGVAEDSGLYAWVRDLMPDEKSRSYFPEPNSFEKVSRTPLMYINEQKLKLFYENEFAFQMATYISMFTFRGVSEEELIQTFQMNKLEVKSLLNQLLKHRIVLKNSQGDYEVPDEAWLQIPDLRDFRATRIKVFQQYIESHFSSPHFGDSTLEMGCSRLLSQRQIDLIKIKVQTLLSWIGMLPDEQGAIPWHFFGAANIAKFWQYK